MMDKQEGLPLKCFPGNERPREISTMGRKKAAENIASGLISYGDFDGDITIEDLAYDILDVTTWDTQMNGYAIARDLDSRHGWFPDARMVEILDGFSSLCDEYLRDEERAWAAENPMEPPLPIGTRVLTKNDGTGIIIGIGECTPYSFKVRVDTIKNGYLVMRFEDALAAAELPKPAPEP